MEHILSSLFFLFFDAMLLVWTIRYHPSIPTKPIYLAERVWLQSWILAQSLNFLVTLFAALFAWFKPWVLLSPRWQIAAYDMYLVAMLTQIAAFGMVMLVDLFEYYVQFVKFVVVYLSGTRNFSLKWRALRAHPTPEEILLNIITRAS